MRLILLFTPAWSIFSSEERKKLRKNIIIFAVVEWKANFSLGGASVLCWTPTMNFKLPINAMLLLRIVVNEHVRREGELQLTRDEKKKLLTSEIWI